MTAGEDFSELGAEMRNSLRNMMLLQLCLSNMYLERDLQLRGLDEKSENVPYYTEEVTNIFAFVLSYQPLSP